MKKRNTRVTLSNMAETMANLLTDAVNKSIYAPAWMFEQKWIYTDIYLFHLPIPYFNYHYCEEGCRHVTGIFWISKGFFKVKTKRRKNPDYVPNTGRVSFSRNGRI